MGIWQRLTDLDARLGAVPAAGESWLHFFARSRSRRPLVAALREAELRLTELERRLAALESRGS